MQTPLISICVPNLNKRQFLQERMESLLAQTFADWEMIVCDSYSNDGSWELLQKFKTDPRVRLYQVPRHGLYAGWNECLRRARGQYINIATSDDTAEPNLLASLLAPLQRRSDIDVAVCDFSEIDAAGATVQTRRYRHREFLGDWMNIPSIRNGKAEFLMKCCFGTTWVTFTSVLFRRKLLDQVGLFQTSQQSHADIDWSLRACLMTDIAFVPGALSHWRVYPGQATPPRQTIQQSRIVRDSLEDILKTEKARMPAEWQTIPEWRDLIMTCRRAMAGEAYQLYRWQIKQSLPQFLSNALLAFKYEPLWFLSRALRGFPAGDELQCDCLETTRRLFATFKPAWPPQPVPQS